MRKKVVLNEQAAAALASGANPATIVNEPEEQEVEESEKQEVEASSTSGTYTVPRDTTGPGVEITEIEYESQSSSDVVVSSAPSQNERISELNERISDLEDRLVDSKVECKTLKADLDKANSANAGMREVTIKRINHMQVALGSPATNCEHMDSLSLLALHNEIESSFQSRYPVGAQAKVPTEGKPTDKHYTQAIPLHVVRGKSK